MKYLNLLLLLVSNAVIAQKVVVNISPSSAQLIVESEPVKDGKKLNLRTPSEGVLAFKEGYVTQGMTFRDLAKKNKESFAFKLEKVSPLSNDYASKVIELKKISDATGKVDKPDRPSLYGIVIPGTDLNSALFTSAINASISEFGYDALAGANEFGDADDKKSGDIQIAANLLYFSKGTRGGGFQVSIIVEWIVYSIKLL